MRILILGLLFVASCSQSNHCTPYQTTGFCCMGDLRPHTNCVIATRGIPPEFYHNADCKCDSTCGCWNLR